jgi:hypothetical protein
VYIAAISSTDRRSRAAELGLRDRVTDIGDVDDVLDLQALPEQRPAQGVRERVGAEVADVCVAVDRRTTAVQPHNAVRGRREVLDPAAE